MLDSARNLLAYVGRSGVALTVDQILGSVFWFILFCTMLWLAVEWWRGKE